MSLCDAWRMWYSLGGNEIDEGVMRSQILAFLDEYCRGMTLQDAQEWYADVFSGDLSVHANGTLLNQP